MTDELARRYEKLKAREVKEKEEKRMAKEKRRKVAEDRFMTVILTTIKVLLALLILGAVLEIMGISSPSSSKKAQKVQSKWEAQRQQRFERQTNAGVWIERGAYIDYRIDSDKLINLSVRQIRSSGYHCFSVNSIKLYKHPERIVVECNEGIDEYRIDPSSGQVAQQ